MNLSDKRRAIRPLLSDRPEDAVADYYAFHHPDEKTGLTLYPNEATRPTGFLTFSRTGMDLFRLLVTLRLPIADLAASAAAIHQAIEPDTAVILFGPASYGPLLHALFDVQTEEAFRLYALSPQRFEPIINVLVMQTDGPNGLPRFIVRSQSTGEVVAAAGLNWQSPRYAEISVTTDQAHRRQGLGQSVAAAMVEYVLRNGRTPLYLVNEQNTPSIHLAEQAGFRDTGFSKLLLQASLKLPLSKQ
ncbi:MAG: GNAT family N-acetyltransferase [Chloroflexi bacterium]|nr:GNAT family N-acetyltransferase [Chloroflexota bacterium]